MKILQVIKGAVWRVLSPKISETTVVEATGPQSLVKSSVGSSGGENQNPPVSVTQENVEDIKCLAVIPLPPHLVPAFIEQNKEAVYTFALKKLKRAISHNEPEILMFRVADSNNVIRIRKHNFVGALGQLQEYFVKIEDYERATVCEKLNRKHHANILIDGT